MQYKGWLLINRKVIYRIIAQSNDFNHVFGSLCSLPVSCFLLFTFLNSYLLDSSSLKIVKLTVREGSSTISMWAGCGQQYYIHVKWHDMSSLNALLKVLQPNLSQWRPSCIRRWPNLGVSCICFLSWIVGKHHPPSCIIE